MYAVRFFETGPVRELILAPRHPYTQALPAFTVHCAMPGNRLNAIPGSPPDLTRLPAGCCFEPRCDRAQDRCRAARPEEVVIDANHTLRCVLAEAAAG